MKQKQHEWGRGREGGREGGRERERERESKAGSRLRAVSTEPDAGLQFRNLEIMIWAEVGRFRD